MEQSLANAEKIINKLNQYKTVRGIRNLLQREQIKGRPRQASACPIACLLKKEVTNFPIFVNSDGIFIDHKKYNTSAPLAEFIYYFDLFKFPELILVDWN